MIKAECVAASRCRTRIATFKVTMPRYILAEFNTHRMFTRNSASSRAIPFIKMLKMVLNNPFIPIAWQKDHKGMQGTEYFTKVKMLRFLWLTARTLAVCIAWILSKLKVTKQLANRLLEPFMWHTVLVTSTEWENFFNLRCPQYVLPSHLNRQQKQNIFKSKREYLFYCVESEYREKVGASLLQWLQINKGQADIHMMAVAEAIYDAYCNNDFKQLTPGEWHIPYGDQINEDELTKALLKLADEKGATLYAGRDLNNLVKQAKIEVAVARCARLSYQTLGDNSKIDYIADIKLYNSLKQNGHWSPFEHVAQAMTEDQYIVSAKTIVNKEGFLELQQGWVANFRGWIQQRAFFENAA